jgi:hypothetical protein
MAGASEGMHAHIDARSPLGPRRSWTPGGGVYDDNRNVRCVAVSKRPAVEQTAHDALKLRRRSTEMLGLKSWRNF